MTDRRTAAPQLSLARVVYTFVGMAFVVLSALIWVLVSNRTSELTNAALDGAVRVRTEAAAQALARTLNADWQDLEQLAGMVATYPESGIAALMAGLRGDGSRISWVGYADTSGIVRVASGNMLEGQDVSTRPWFRSGLRGGFAGDVHEAVLLASLLPARDGGETVRFMDLALPVRDADGEVTGVLGMHIDAGWVRQLMSETAEVLNLDLFLLSADGVLALATTEAEPVPSELSILRAARAGTATAGRETWPDGEDYFASLVPDVSYGTLPSFGWRLVGRLEAASFAPTLRGAFETAIAVGIAAIALLAGMTAIFVYLFIRPIEALALSAERIADGAEEFPPERGNTRETTRLSGALVRLQQDRDDGVSGSAT